VDSNVKRRKQDLLGSNVARKDTETVQRKAAPAMPVELTCPDFTDVRGVPERGGFTFSSADDGAVSGRRLCGAEFPTVEELRSDLCAYGVDCACEYESNGLEGLPCLCWDDNDKQLIHTWVRYQVFQGMRQLMRVFQLSRMQAYNFVRRLGFGNARSSAYDGKGRGYPHMQTVTDGIDGVTKFQTLDGLLLSLSRFGLPENCSFHNLSGSERLSLELYLATYCSVANAL
jgi:hypothetical protein